MGPKVPLKAFNKVYSLFFFKKKLFFAQKQEKENLKMSFQMSKEKKTQPQSLVTKNF